MKTLAIDSSLSAGSVAALFEGSAAERTFPVAGEHGRRIAAALAAVAGELGWSPADAELLAVVRGPGSFTSLRVGVTTAKAIAWANGARLLGVSAFEVIARQSAGPQERGSAPIAIAYDAGRGDVFAATAVPATHSPTGWIIGAPGLYSLPTWLASLERGACISGPALAIFADQIAQRPDLLVAPRAAWIPTAIGVGNVAILRAAAGESDDPQTLVPDYLRPSYAHENDSRSSR